MISRTRPVTALLLTALLLLSGCTAAITGSEPIAFEADPAGVDAETVNEREYEQVDQQNLTAERTVSFAEQERTVKITNHLTSYEKQTGPMPAGGMLTVFSSPSAEVLGQAVNPITRMSNDQLVSTVVEQSESESIENIEKVSEHNVTVNGEKTTVTKYEGTTTIEGERVDVYLHLTKIQVADDTIVAVGVYPQEAESFAHDDMDALMQGLQHE